jgi:hypothetical protein
MEDKGGYDCVENQSNFQKASTENKGRFEIWIEFVLDWKNLGTDENIGEQVQQNDKIW